MAKRRLLPESGRRNVSEAQNAEYALSLKKLLDCKTVWEKDGRNAAEYERFYNTLREEFPLLHSHPAVERLVFGEGCFFYRIKGEKAQRNILLMSHHDVVDGGEGWDSPPFDAVIKNGALWGRGAVDTKTPLFAELRAAEELLGEGFDFAGINLYIGSSHNEEVSGDGMVLAVEYFRQQGIRFDVILDEGGAITTGMIPGVSAKSAVIAVHEKGRHAFKCTVRENSQGHGGLNPASGSVVSSISLFIARLEKERIFKADFAPEVKATFTRHAAYMAFPLNLVFGNFGLFSPIIKRIMMKIPQASAMLSTGCTFTSINAGDEDNPHFKAKEASACMFLRCVREDRMYAELERIKKIAAEYGVEIEETLRDYCRPTDFEAAPFKQLEKILHRNFPDVITVPFLLTAGTDARRFSDIADNILRFAPIDLNKQQFASIHGKNENISIQNIGQCVLFYKDFIKEI